MNKFKLQEAHTKLLRKLSSIKWLQKWNLNKLIVDGYLRSEDFSKRLEVMFENLDFSCKSALHLLEPLIFQLVPDHSEDNWLYYLYQFSLSKSFPDAVQIELDETLSGICEFYLRTLRVMCEFEKSMDSGSFVGRHPLEFLSSEEEYDLEKPDEYSRFVKAFKHDHIYEMMKLCDEVMGFSTLEHVSGVHSLALNMARQLKAKGIKVDLGRVSGAAAGHDIGKYGCRATELAKVPRLHYYYTDIWFKKHSINYIRNIAINHSTWDLELENLPIESLLLIYADFRVKNDNSAPMCPMKIFDLKDSFKVILDKLENVDDAKMRRYKKVYSKLQDFESYLLYLNVDIHCNADNKISREAVHSTSYALLQGAEIIRHVKYLAIKHNIWLMYELRDEYSLDLILEAARSESDWKKLRDYIRVFEEYSTYFTQKQKLQTLAFLYENLVHPEDDIRRHCAELIGSIISMFDEVYRKELPENAELPVPSQNSTALFEQYVDLMLNPGHKIIPSHRFYIGYSLSIMVDSLFSHCSEEMMPKYRNILMRFYSEPCKTNESLLFLLETAKHVPIDPHAEDLENIFSFLLGVLGKRSTSLKLASLESMHHFIAKKAVPESFNEKIIKLLRDHARKDVPPSQALLLHRMSMSLHEEELAESYGRKIRLNENSMTEMFLSNLKSATDWIKKKNQIDLLLLNTLENESSNKLQTAIHYCNLLKVSAVESVRNHAGLAILEIMPHLSISERNEVAVELLRALEIEGNRFTEYIPMFTGQAILWVQPKELDEIIDDLHEKIKTSNPNLKSLILKLIGITISNYPVYPERFDETPEIREKRLMKMLGILLGGLGDYNIEVKKTAFSVIGKDIFDTSSLSMDSKVHMFKLIAKKVLTLITDNKNEELLFLTNSASLNHIYRFIGDYSFFHGDIDMGTSRKVAFFPGTFDPFSLSHKRIATSIRDKGFEVYLAVDEFSWSKRTLPSLLRRDILSMSIADELNIYIYPDNHPANLSNPYDLKKLRESFREAEVYVAMGSDVVLNASCYRCAETENSIFSFPHIIFQRSKNRKISEIISKIKGDVIYLTLPAMYSDISSTQIRRNMDENRDISTLVDPVAQSFIYENGFYQREPLDKSTFKPLQLNTLLIEEHSERLLEDLKPLIPELNPEIASMIKAHFSKPSGRIMVLKDDSSNEVLGFSMFHWARSSTIYSETKSEKISEHVRRNNLGRLIILDGIMTKHGDKCRSSEQILLTETMAFCISRDYEHAIYMPLCEMFSSVSLLENLKSHGFVQMPGIPGNRTACVVDMRSPCSVTFDLENVIKEPFRSLPAVRNVTSHCRQRLLDAIRTLYPGQFILTLDMNYMNQCMIRKICAENNVPAEVLKPRKLGEAMCVPYGEILDRHVIPNTVTKALHTEKYYEPDMKKFTIAEVPHYMNLENQVKMLKSFNRPVILVDNVLHKGYRMKALDPLFKKEGIHVKKIIAGILSGRGKDLMDMQNRQVDSIYFIPRLRLWFNENSLYPFIGGDSVWRGHYPERNLLPSANLIMPYASPVFIKSASTSAIFNFSRTCIENSIQILETLENEYHMLNSRNLTLSSLGHVFTIPRCVDKGNNLQYDLSLRASGYLMNDLEMLIRMESMINGM